MAITLNELKRDLKPWILSLIQAGGAGPGPYVSGTGTANKVTYWTSANNVAAASHLTVGTGALTVQPASDNIATFAVKNAASTALINLDTSNLLATITGLGVVQRTSQDTYWTYRTTPTYTTYNTTPTLTGVSAVWADPTGISTGGSTYTTTSPALAGAAPVYSGYLYADINATALPITAQIVGIVATINRRKSTAASTVTDYVIQFCDVATRTLSGDNKAKADAWGGAEIKTYGSSTDDWNASITAGKLNAGNVGLAINIVKTNNLDSPQGEIDTVSITIYYTDDNSWSAGTIHSSSKFAISPGADLTNFGALSLAVDTTAGTLTLATTAILNIAQQLKSSLSTGTSPFSIASTTVNTNLNADLLDGYHASSFVSAGAGFVAGIVAKTADYTMTTADYTCLVTCSSVNITITLPAAASNTGRIYNIKKVDATAYTVIIDGNASETIDGTTTKTLTLQYESLTIQCDGSNWMIL